MSHQEGIANAEIDKTGTANCNPGQRLSLAQPIRHPLGKLARGKLVSIGRSQGTITLKLAPLRPAGRDNLSIDRVKPGLAKSVSNKFC